VIVKFTRALCRTEYKIRNSKSTTTMAIVYGKTTLPSLPTLHKFPNNCKFFFFYHGYLYRKRVTTCNTAVSRWDGKDQWLHKSIVWRWKEGTPFVKLMHVVDT